MAGRPPKPVEQKIREGNPGKRKLQTPVLVGGKATPPMPKGLTSRAKTVWNSLVPKLVDAGLVDTVDVYSLEGLVESVALMRKARDQLDKSPLIVEGSTGQARRNPLFDVFMQSQGEVRRWCDLFGLHPSARAKLGLQMVKAKSLAAEIDDQLGNSRIVDAEVVDDG